eukprot:scaffold38634_cov61-Cyclotella_meneghiniana.AAC.3
MAGTSEQQTYLVDYGGDHEVYLVLVVVGRSSIQKYSTINNRKEIAPRHRNLRSASPQLLS